MIFSPETIEILIRGTFVFQYTGNYPKLPSNSKKSLKSLKLVKDDYLTIIRNQIDITKWPVARGKENKKIHIPPKDKVANEVNDDWVDAFLAKNKDDIKLVGIQVPEKYKNIKLPCDLKIFPEE